VFTRAIILGCLIFAVTLAAQPRVLRWAGDPEGGAPFVEADPARVDRVVGFDVEIAALLSAAVRRTPEFVNVRFESI
jgi:polar amino acid transport system substrate-binding protein